MPTTQYLDDGRPDGAMLGSGTAALISLWGAVPATQPSGAAQAAVTTEAATTGAATYGLTSAQANTVVTLLNKIRTDLIAVGIIKGS